MRASAMISESTSMAQRKKETPEQEAKRLREKNSELEAERVLLLQRIVSLEKRIDLFYSKK